MGIPTWIRRSKSLAFASLKERVWKKIKGWKQQTSSSVGREILLKAIVQALPTYLMNFFNIPNGFCSDIQRMMARWWGCKEDDRRIHWVAWEKMCKSKENGGLGFLKVVDFNEAMLAKQGWRLLQNPELLATRVLKARYFPNSSFMDSSIGSRPSYIWRSIWGCKWVLEKGCIWVVGDGESINICKDPWVDRPYSFWVISPRPPGCTIARESGRPD